mmetsp:Transcript_19213/g.47480  ORF Transcript_19213/g.47480 Transcript_19213/m.47480 type:complete len:204 (+) Transcript_19213:111-722(+)
MVLLNNLVKLLLLCAMVALGVNAQLRGGHPFEFIKRRMESKKDEALSRGELRERFGLIPKKAPQATRKRRKLEESGSLRFTGIYNEIASATDGATTSTVGAVFGLNGFMYDVDTGDAIGSLEGTCTVSAANSEHFCTYHLLFGDGDNAGLVIASGTLTFGDNDGGFMIVEATAFNLDGYEGGVFTLRYDSIANYIFTGEIDLV